MTNTTLIAKTSWNDGRIEIDTIAYTADEMAEIFLRDENDALSRARSPSAAAGRASATSMPRRWR